LDDDDIWYPGKLQFCMAEAERHPEAVLVCHAQNVVKRQYIKEEYLRAVDKRYA